MKKILLCALVLCLFLTAPLALAAENLPRGKSMEVTIDDWAKNFNERLALLGSERSIAPYALIDNDDRMYYAAPYADHISFLFLCEKDTEEVVGILLQLQFNQDDYPEPSDIYEDSVKAGEELPMAVTAMVWACDNKLPVTEANEIANELTSQVTKSPKVGDDHRIEKGAFLYRFHRSAELSMSFSARLIEDEGFVTAEEDQGSMLFCHFDEGSIAMVMRDDGVLIFSCIFDGSNPNEEWRRIYALVVMAELMEKNCSIGITSGDEKGNITRINREFAAFDLPLSYAGVPSYGLEDVQETMLYIMNQFTGKE